jgi:hypothetical protein
MRVSLVQSSLLRPRSCGRRVSSLLISIIADSVIAHAAVALVLIAGAASIGDRQSTTRSNGNHVDRSTRNMSSRTQGQTAAY